MHTKAVYRAAQGFNDAGLVALRFNFRGVGTSTGSHDEGHGEQDDVRAALDWLEPQFPHLPLVVGGFSFGSMVGLSVGVDDDRVEALLGMGLPVEMGPYDFSFLGGTDKPTLVVQGEQDEFGSGAAVAELIQPLGPHITLVRVPGAFEIPQALEITLLRVPETDHFFEGKLQDLRSVVRGYFGSGPGARLMAGI